MCQEKTTLKKALNQFDQYNAIRVTIDHYTLIRNMLKNYVIKVLFRKVMYVAMYTLQLQEYYGAQTLDVSESERRAKQDSLDSAVFTIHQFVCSFHASFRLFLSNKYSGFSASNDVIFTIKALMKITEHLASLITGTLINPKMAIQEINSIASSEFLSLIPDDGQNPINHYSEPPRVKPSPDDLITIMENVNISIIFIVEALTPPM